MTATPYADVLARNIRAARSRVDINQETLAGRMRALGFSAWLRQTVANVEKGKRRITAEEILGLGYALETSMSALIRATEDDGLVTFPGGTVIAAVSVRRSAEGRNDGSVRWEGTSLVAEDADLVQLEGLGIASLTRVSRGTGIVQEHDPDTGEWKERQ